MSAAARADARPPRLPRRDVAHAVLRARARAVGRRVRATAAAGTSCSATATWTDERDARPRSSWASTPRPTTSGRGAGRDRLEVKNAERLPALQALCDEYGVRPTYLVTHEMATRPESARHPARPRAGGGRCEIGAHLHPWSSPPFRPEDLAAHTYPAQPAPGAARPAAHASSRTTIEQSIGVRPTTYRAGRNGFDGRHAAHPRAPRLHRRHQRGPALQRAPQGRHGLRGRAACIPTTRRTTTCGGRGPRRCSRSRSPPPPSPRLPKALEARLRVAARDPLAGRAASGWACAGLAAPLLHVARPHDRLRVAAGRARARRASTSSSTPASCSPAAARTRPTRPASSASWPTCARCSSTSTGGWARWAGPTPSSRATGPRGMNVLMVTPHLPPYQAANALLPHLLGRGAARSAATRSRYPHLRPRRPGVGRRRLRAAPLAPAARDPRPRRPLEAVETWMRARPLVAAADVVHVHSSTWMNHVAARLARARAARRTCSRTTAPRSGTTTASDRALPALQPRRAPRELLQPGAHGARARAAVPVRAGSVVYPPVADDFRAAAPRGSARRCAARYAPRRGPLLLNVKRLHPAGRPGHAPARVGARARASGPTRRC